MPIGPFLLRRIATSLVAVLGVSLLVFFVLHLTPGDPVDRLAGGDATEAQRQAIRRCMALDRPLGEQLTIFLGHIADGSLGHQCPDPAHQPTVAARVAAALPYTVELALGGMLVALLFALPLGLIAAVRRGTWVDAAAASVSLLGISMPTMWIGPLAIYVFFIHLAWLPGPHDADARGALILPSLVVGTHLMAMLSRMTRASMVEVLAEDYMRTARAKGLSPAVVLLKHGLQNALLPVVTVAGLQLGSLLGGAIITEKIFARPGLGTLLLEGISERNYPLVQGTVLVIAVAYAAVNLATDLCYGVIDPRVRRA
jgi:ABC-type dipeptide/oligopeptide/nickel transport system permease component